MKQTVYKKAKTGKIQVYTGWTEGADVVSEYGEQGGAMQQARITCVAKNVGRSNETTPEQQAELELAAKIQKKKDSGYFDTPQEALTEQVFLPMLAYDYKKRAGKLEIFDGQPKYDGVRALIHYQNGWKIMSRGGKPYDVAHIVSHFERFGDPSIVYDGEIYIHGLPLQEIVSLVKKPKPGSELLQFHCYDMYQPDRPDLPWGDRRKFLYDFGQAVQGSAVHIVETVTHLNETNMKALHDQFVREGFEGLILREHHGTYELSKRSRHLLKYKEFHEEEFPIVGFETGRGKFDGCVIWKCSTPDGAEFKVVPKGTLEQKQKWLIDAHKYIGKPLVVRYQALTNDKVPQFPVGITIRDYE